MKVLVLGATGGTGRATVTAAKRAGHEVTVLVRDAAKVTDANDVRVLTGDVTDRSAVDAALIGQDALISALGGGSSLSTTIASDAAAVFVPVAQAAGTSRVVELSAFGVGDSRQHGSALQKAASATVMKKVFADKAVADDLLAASGLDYTIVRPVTLTDGPATGSPAVGPGHRMKGMPSVSRADVAEVMVNALTDATLSRTTVVVG